MHMLPRRIPGSKAALSDQLVVSILIDRMLLLECGRSVLLMLSAEEARNLYEYLVKHQRKFTQGGTNDK